MFRDKNLASRSEVRELLQRGSFVIAPIKVIAYTTAAKRASFCVY